MRNWRIPEQIRPQAKRRSFTATMVTQASVIAATRSGRVGNRAPDAASYHHAGLIRWKAAAPIKLIGLPSPRATSSPGGEAVASLKASHAR